jgi:hypothetical protein
MADHMKFGQQKVSSYLVQLDNTLIEPPIHIANRRVQLDRI